MMQMRTLGTDLNVSAVGLGCMGFSHAYGAPTEEAEAVRLIRRAFDLGYTFFDTAEVYGTADDPHVNETLVGKALADVKNHTVIATKFGLRFDQESGKVPLPLVADSRPETIRKSVEGSLKRLGTDHIDLYQFHNPSPENLDKILAPGGAMEALLEAKAKGVVGHIGITAHLSQTFEKALKVDEIETIMFPYNIVEQQGKELIDRCAEKGKAFIDMKPLAGGAIEDGRLALRYVLSNPAVTVSIPGMAAPEELEQNVAGSANTAPLTPEEKVACQKVRDTLGTQFCRRCNYCAPCTVGIQIPSCFLFHGYLERYGLAGWAHERYDTLTVKAGACIGCGKCETRCPYNLPIRDMLKKVAQDFGE